MKLVLSKLLLKYEVLPCEQTEVPLNVRGPGNIVNPKNGIWLSFKPIITNFSV